MSSKASGEGLPLVGLPKLKGVERTASCLSQPQESALDALKEGNMQLLSDIITDAGDTFDVNREYPEEKFKTLLHLAAERADVEAARLLVAAGAEVNTVNRLLHTTPLHVAVRKDAVEIVRALLSRKANVNVVTADGKTALHLCAKRTADQPGNAAAANCLQLLLSATDVEVDKRDANGNTALYVAANTKGGSEYYVSVIKQFVIKGADISIKCDGNSIRDVIEARVSKREFQSILDLFDSAGEGSGPSAASAIINNLKEFINDPSTRNDWRAFQVKLDLAPEADLRRDGLLPGELSLLQRAAQLGLHAHVQSILAKGVDPNLTPEGTKPALILAAENGHHQVIDAMRLHKLSNGGDATVATTDFGAVDRASGSCVLHAVLRRPYSQGASGQRLRLSARDDNIDARYEQCLDVLLQAHGDARSSMERDLRRVINTVDYEGCTPLHYATQLWPQRVVRKLLEKGANIGMRNVYDEIPIESIQPDTLKDFLDEFCLQSEGDLTNRNLRVTVRYDFLAPPRCDDLEDVRVDGGLNGGQNGLRKEGWTSSSENGLTQRQSFKLESSMSTGDRPEKVPVPETEILWHMRQSSRHRHLLQHPVITSFLWLKWKRISWAYNYNLVFYFAFVSFLTGYVFAIYGGKSLRTHSVLAEQCDAADNPEGIDDTHAQFYGPPQDTKALWHITTILLGFLTVRELAQFLIAPRRYFFSLENWLEMVLVALTSVLLFHGDYGCNVEEKRHVAAFVIVISWSELITVIGRHPKLSTYNIYVTMFYKVSTTFVRFLIWYSLFIFAFALGFYILLHKDDGHEEKADEYRFFDFLGLCMVKTFTMFVGELEFSDLPIETPVGYLFFLVFIFLIVVVMMNLLNGLAVSDTGAIQREAEINSYLCQVDVISYIESMLLGDPFNFLSNWPTFVWLRRLPSCSLGQALYRVPSLRAAFHAVTGAKGVLLFFDTLPDKTIDFFPNRDRGMCAYIASCTQKELADFHPSIMEAAKAVILERKMAENSLEERMVSAERLLQALVQQGEAVKQQLEEISRAVSSRRH